MLKEVADKAFIRIVLARPCVRGRTPEIRAVRRRQQMQSAMGLYGQIPVLGKSDPLPRSRRPGFGADSPALFPGCQAQTDGLEGPPSVLCTAPR